MNAMINKMVIITIERTTEITAIIMVEFEEFELRAVVNTKVNGSSVLVLMYSLVTENIGSSTNI